MENRYQLVVFEGRTLAPKRHLLGNNGLVEVSPPLDLVDSFARWGTIYSVMAPIITDIGMLVHGASKTSPNISNGQMLAVIEDNHN